MWTLDRDKLIGFFRSNDDTSDVTGKRQAITFETLSALAGHGELPNYSNSKTPTTRDNRGELPGGLRQAVSIIKEAKRNPGLL